MSQDKVEGSLTRSDDYYMGLALQEARMALEIGEIPVGAVIVANEQVLSRAHNQTEQLQDVTAHAEMLAITSATNRLQAKYLPNATLFVTLEPCVMCAGAIFWAQIGKLVFGAFDPKRGFLKQGEGLLHPKARYKGGIREAECAALLRQFFKEKR